MGTPNHMTEQIRLDDLKLGYRLAGDVHEMRADGNRVLLYARGQEIATERQLQRLRDAGVSVVPVDHESLRLDLAPEQRCSEERIVEFQELRHEVLAARQEDRAAQQRLDGFFSPVREGGRPEATELEEQLLGSFTRQAERAELALVLMLLRRSQPFIHRHSLNVTGLLLRFSRELDPEMTPAQLARCGLAALLHDVGLLHCGLKLDDLQAFGDEQSEEFRLHPDFGIEILKDLAGIPAEVRRAVAEHHERFNGGGYPQGLRDSEIHWLSYRVGLCDAFEMLVSEQSYRRALPLPAAVNLVQGWAGREFPAELVQAFCRSLGRWPVGSAVELSSGERGRIALAGREGGLPVVASLREGAVQMIDLAAEGLEIRRGLNGGFTELGPFELF
jgi:HD-GYP domain-containing protein (c-di-GMP phosphodiesterase class II)